MFLFLDDREDGSNMSCVSKMHGVGVSYQIHLTYDTGSSLGNVVMGVVPIVARERGPSKSTSGMESEPFQR